VSWLPGLPERIPAGTVAWLSDPTQLGEIVRECGIMAAVLAVPALSAQQAADDRRQIVQTRMAISMADRHVGAGGVVALIDG
jgi:hypothetical protein